MFLALRDLRRSGARFLLVGLVVVLVSFLTTVLGGLADGLVSDGISGVRALPFDHMAFEKGARATYSRSVLGDDDLTAFQATAGVEATPVGVTFTNAKAEHPTGTPDRDDLDIALFGVEPDGFLIDRPADREALAGEPGLVLSGALADDGVEVGDRYTFTASGTTLPVVGFTRTGSYGHAPLAFVPLTTWQQLNFGSDARGRFSAVALRLDDGVTDAVAATAAATGTEIETKTGTYDGSPGYTAQQTTMTLIRGFLLVISALVVGAFFTVLILQRTRQIGLLKAMGASSWYVIRDGLGQMVVIVTVATLVGAGFGAAAVAFMQGTDAPIELVPSSALTGVVLLIVAGTVGSVVPLKRVTSIEPAIALGAGEP